MALEEFMAKFPDEGFFFAAPTHGNRVVRCRRSQKIISGDNRDYCSILKHVETAKKHLGFLKQCKLSQLKDAQIFNAAPGEPGAIRTNLDGTRESSMLEDDQAFRFRVTQMMIAAGIPLNTVTVIRPALEDMCQVPLASPNMLASEYIHQIFSKEVETQLEELKGEQISVCFDATPSMGDVFALIVRYIETTAEGMVGNMLGIVLGTKHATHIYFPIGLHPLLQVRPLLSIFLESSMNSAHVCLAIQKGLASQRLLHADECAASADGCLVNLKAHIDIEQDYNIKWFLNICISHCTNNAGDQANFPTFATLWSLLMKVFISDTAKIIWERTTQCAWLLHLSTCWFSKYDVIERLFKYFGDIQGLLERMVQNNVSPANYGKLLNLFEDHSTKWHARTELSAYIECIFFLRNFCYQMEGDGDLICFAAYSTEELLGTFPDR
jgi:hypothetical protein